MAKLKKKKVELQGEFTEKGIIAFPRFYIKAVGGAFSLEHRLTHTFMASYATEEELVEGLKEFGGMGEYELYKWLITNRYAHIPNKNYTSRFEDSAEDWYLNAWGVYTTRFYKEHPELFSEVKDIPRDIVTQVRMERVQESTPKRPLSPSPEEEVVATVENRGDVPGEKPATSPVKPRKRPLKKSPSKESLPIIKEGKKKPGKVLKRKVHNIDGVLMPDIPDAF